MSTHHQLQHDAVVLLHRIGALAHATALPGPSGLREVARLGPLPCWFAVQEPAATRQLAARLSRRGELGLMITAEPHGAHHLLCVTVPPVRATAIGTHETESLALSRLARISPAGSLLGTAIACASALDIDAAGRRAFRAMRSAIEGAVTRLPATIPLHARHAWVLLQVTRLLFLRFVEAEGWLAGRTAFLVEEFDHCMQRGGFPERHLLAPLFFGTLNRPAHTRSRRALAFGAIPFLNGGLFEPHPIERRRTWVLPRDGWQELFALAVESFEVSLDRGDVGDRVSPELLGRVLEGMMSSGERKAAGTFYTPTALVPAVLRATLCSHLALRLGCPESTIDRRLDDRDPELDCALLSLRILDPAVGSGAFLVGALNLVCTEGHTSAARVRHVITRRLFGVDRNPAAVRLTELRLWLELLRTMRGRAVGKVSPLPNLDTTIRAGDALFDPFAGLRLPRTLARRLTTRRRNVVSAHGTERRGAVAALRRMEQRAANQALRNRARIIRETIADLIDQAHSTDLFGGRGVLRADTERRVMVLRRELRDVRREHRRLQTEGTVAAFGMESAFAGVLDRGGFDLVVGNPPWVRGDRLPPRERDTLAARYRWWRTGGSGWRHTPDLCVAFVERSVEVLAPHGTFGLLVPSKLATAGYAARCRAALAEQATLHMVTDLERDPRASFEATTYPLALVASKQRADTGHPVALDLLRERSVPQDTWRGAASWSLGAPPLQRLAQRLAQHPTLHDTCVPSLGVKTGANQAFLNPPPELHEFTRPAIRGRDVRALTTTPSVRLLWPADDRGNPWPSLPAALDDYLATHRQRLERRTDLVRPPWWQLFRTASATAPWRVTWSDLAPMLRAAPLHDPAPVPLNSCYVVALPDERAMAACAAWLNAGVVRALARGIAEPAANGYARFGARAVGAVPLPPGALHDEELAALGRATWTHEVADAIDRIVARWLVLTPAECEAVRALDATRG